MALRPLLNVAYAELTANYLDDEGRQSWHETPEPGVGEPGGRRRPAEQRNKGLGLLLAAHRMPREK